MRLVVERAVSPTSVEPRPTTRAEDAGHSRASPRLHGWMWWLHRDGGERGLARRASRPLCISADGGDGMAFQAHTAIREVEGGDDADDAQGMPLLVHAVAWVARCAW